MKMPKEKNELMEAFNSMKQAVSQIDKLLTKQDINEEGLEQDGNTGEAEGGEQDYSKIAYDAKLKMMKAGLIKGSK